MALPGLPEFTLFEVLRNTTDADPLAHALVDPKPSGEKSFTTYEELLLRSARLASAYRRLGIRRGDRVAIYVEKSPEAVVAMLAAVHAGAVFVNVNPLLRPLQVAHILRDSEARLLVVDGDKLDGTMGSGCEAVLVRGEVPPPSPVGAPWFALEPILDDHPPLPLDANATEVDLGAILYTSGSTGMPKGVMLSHRNLVAGAQIVSEYLHNTSSDRVLSVLPLAFDAGLNQLTTMVRVGGTLVLQRSPLPGDILGSLRRERITGLCGVPPVWTLLLQCKDSLAREPLRHLRYISNTGGQIPQAQLDALRALLPHTEIVLMYGLTEAFRSTYLPPSELDRGTACIGKAIPNTDVWVVDEHGRECAADEVGELVHRGPTVALGYWGDPERTAAVYRVNPFAPPQALGRDVVVHSGDLVRRDAEGFLYYVGRRDEQIKTQGYRLSPHEIEELLHGTGLVREAAVFGRPDPTLGHVVVAVVSLLPGAEAGAPELRRLCGQRAPAYMVPREIHILDELPKNGSGKIDRSKIRDAYLDRA